MLERGQMIDLKNARKADDGKLIKNKLPEKIRDKFLTENQWLDKGMQPKKGAKPIEMHANAFSQKTFMYYFEEDVKTLSSTTRICATCRYRYMNEGECIVAGSRVSPKGSCSEWDKKK